MAVHKFESIEDFAKACHAIPTYDRAERNDAWFGYISFKEALEKSLTGDESYVASANALIEKLDVTMPETRAFKVIHSPYGGRANLGDWLAGAPLPMRRRVRTSSEFGPINIFVSTTSSAGVSADTMLKRGTAILALLLKLQQIRPIQLYLLAELHGASEGWQYHVIKVESQPLAVGVAAFALCHVGFARHLTYDYGHYIDNFNGAWPDGYFSSLYAHARIDRLGATSQDLVIKEVYLKDELVQRPIEWLTKQLEKYSQGGSDAS